MSEPSLISGFYLTMFTFTEDGNKDFFPDRLQARLSEMAAAMPAQEFAKAAPLVEAEEAARLKAEEEAEDAAAIERGEPAPSSFRRPGESRPPGPRFINMYKRSMTAELLRDIQQYQSPPYNLAKCKPVWDFMMAGLEGVESHGDLYEMSLALEPREREEERM